MIPPTDFSRPPSLDDEAEHDDRLACALALQTLGIRPLRGDFNTILRASKTQWDAYCDRMAVAQLTLHAKA
jgi:hypothetical protein